MYGVDYLSSQYVATLTQRYPAFAAQISNLTNELSSVWTKYKNVEEQVKYFQGTTDTEAYDLNAQVKSLQNTIASKSAELSGLLCTAQKTELVDNIREADWVLIPE
jgi:predicted  nucleic acid-binding Zn-ribbon protein